ncbi:MAG: amidohydrolase family protein, partial [Desulfobacterales bacterium]|nr:amidohydrolase family protein [Desulfobacterales bacterium]
EASVPAGEILVIKARLIYTAAGDPIENGIILIRDGKFAAVGKGLSIPAGAKVLEAEVVMPGIVDIHSHLGVYSTPAYEANNDGNEMTDPVTPQVRAIDSFNFRDPALKSAMIGGVTTIVTRPGSGNVIGGTGTAVKLKHGSLTDMVFKEICDLKMTIEGNPIHFHGRKGKMPTSLMSVYHLARKAFLDARSYMERREKFDAEKSTNQPPPCDPGMEILALALRREIPVHIHTSTAADIMSCIRLAKEFNLRLTLAHCELAYLIAEEPELNHPDIHFNTGPAMFLTHFGHILESRNLPAILADAGLKVSLQIDAVSGRQPAQQYMLHAAALCVRRGMKPTDALLAVTIRGAQAAGLDDRVGSIEPGKDADLVFLNGDPFDWLTRVDRVMIDGSTEFVQNKPSEAPLGADFDMMKAKESSSLHLPENFDGMGEYLVRAGWIFTSAGTPVKEGMLHVKDGRIAAVGKDVLIPSGIPVIDASEFVIVPGMIAARSHLGIASNWAGNTSIDESTLTSSPQIEVKNAIEPQHPLFAHARSLGITSALVTPGDTNPIGGQGVVIKTYGRVVDRMVLRDRAVMMFALGESARRKDRYP